MGQDISSIFVNLDLNIHFPQEINEIPEWWDRRYLNEKLNQEAISSIENDIRKLSHHFYLKGYGTESELRSYFYRSLGLNNYL